MSLKCILVANVATCIHIALKVFRVIKLIYIACKLKVIVGYILGCPSKGVQLRQLIIINLRVVIVIVAIQNRRRFSYSKIIDYLSIHS